MTLFDDPNAERFSREVAQNADKYYHDVLEGPVSTMTGALRRMWHITGDRKYDAAATDIEGAFSTLSSEASLRADQFYDAYQETAADPNADPAKGPASVLDPGALEAVNRGWKTAASLSHVNDQRAIDAQAIVRRVALQLQNMLDERSGADAFDEAVLDPAAKKHLL